MQPHYPCISSHPAIWKLSPPQDGGCLGLILLWQLATVKEVWLPRWSIAGSNVPSAEHSVVIKAITVSIMYLFLHTMAGNFSLVCSLWREHWAVGVCKNKLDRLSLYTPTLKTVHELEKATESDRNWKSAWECVYWLTSPYKSLWLQLEKGKLSIN